MKTQGEKKCTKAIVASIPLLATPGNTLHSAGYLQDLSEVKVP
jgi:hypothetical protein